MERNSFENPIEPNEITPTSMYSEQKVAALFAEREENYKHVNVAEAVSQVILKELENIPNPLHLAELGGGAHPDRYHKLFDRLLQSPHGVIDWVDSSPYMLELAHKYLEKKNLIEREQVIRYVKSDIFLYLKNLSNETLDGGIMKYTIQDIEDLDQLFGLLALKLKGKSRCLVATMGELSPVLKSYSSNARYLYKGQEIPDDETRTLEDGEMYGIKFFNETNNPQAGYLPGAETVKYFHSLEKMKALADKYHFGLYAGDWKVIADVPEELKTTDQNVLVLRR